jgi:putative tricarboxylic transport membrane protein
VGEVFWYLAEGEHAISNVPSVSLQSLIPRTKDLILCAWAMLRGSLIGFFTGVLPGMGAVSASFISYSVEKRVSKHPENFGKGAIEGLASPESANNSAVIGALLPIFSLGIPGSATTAILLGGLMMWGIQPGPLLMSQHPEVVWPVIASLYIANFVLLAINLPGSAVLAQISRIPPRWLMPLVLAISLTGTYVAKSNLFGPVIALIFGVVGFIFRKTGYPMAPLLLGLVLGESIEQNLRRSLVLFHGNPTFFFTRPLCDLIIILTLVLIFAGIRISRSRPSA